MEDRNQSTSQLSAPLSYLTIQNRMVLILKEILEWEEDLSFVVLAFTTSDIDYTYPVLFSSSAVLGMSSLLSDHAHMHSCLAGSFCEFYLLCF